MLPIKTEMDELDRLLGKASGILMRWNLKMTPAEEAEYPTVSESIRRAERAFSEIANTLTAISAELGFGMFREEPLGADGVSEQLPGYPSPRVYGDWVNLAEDIKARDPSLASKVNYNLGLILHDLPGSENAKRWLTRKAGELGIK